VSATSAIVTDTSGAVVCAACGEAEPLGLVVCARCAGLARNGRPTLVLLRRPPRSERDHVMERLTALFGPAIDPLSTRAAATGERALFKVPAPAAPAIVDALESRGMHARAVAAERAWMLMPAHFFVLLVAIVTVGTLAGASVSPLLSWTSPLLAVLLLLSAQTTTARAIAEPPGLRGTAVLRRPVIEALAVLPRGRPRALLADLLSLARPLLAGAHMSRDVGRIVGELLAAAAATAHEVDRLEQMQTTLEQHHLLDTATADVRAAALVCDRARRTGTARLESALAALAQLAGASADDAAAAGERLAELTRTLGLESQARAGAAQEVATLLRPAARSAG
jgi:hypothetical protein